MIHIKVELDYVKQLLYSRCLINKPEIICGDMNFQKEGEILLMSTSDKKPEFQE